MTSINELTTDAARVEWVYRTMLNRRASPSETSRAVRFLRESIATDAAIAAEQWARLCQTIFATSEFQILN